MLTISPPSADDQAAADELFDRNNAHQPATAPFLVGYANPLADDLTGPLSLTQDQADQLRVIARGLRYQLHQKAQDIKDNPAKEKDWRKQVEAAVLMSEGILSLSAELLDDPDIIENPETL
jgi:hypothetical protein